MEMCYSNSTGGIEVDITGIPGETTRVLFSEKPGVVIQANNPHVITALFEKEGIQHHVIGRPVEGRMMTLRTKEENLTLDIDHYREISGSGPPICWTGNSRVKSWPKSVLRIIRTAHWISI